MKNAVVVGYGMVGRATMKSLGIDKYYSRSAANVTEKELSSFKYVFLCLPTPTVDGKQDITAIEYYIKLLAEAKKENIIILRSTVLPFTCAALEQKYNVEIAHVPEFLTESTWEEDCKWPDIVVVGANNDKLRDTVINLLEAYHEDAKFFVTTTKVSETIKYAVNTLYALKVVFANQIYDYCIKNGIEDYDIIKSAMYARKWIGKNHLEVWHKGKRGAGGKCLNKDLEAFANESGLRLLQVANFLNKIYLHGNTETTPPVR